MAYVAPNWKNGAAPALDAAALQAISDAIVADQTKNTQQDSSISSLESAVSSLQSNGAKISMGSYVGTGAYGEGNHSSVLAKSSIKILWIYACKNNTTGKFVGFDSGPSTVLTVSRNALSTSYKETNGPNYGGTAYATIGTSGGLIIFWYNTISAKCQLNMSGYTYYWLAIL